MNRTPFLAAVLVLGGLLGAAEVRSASNERQNRLSEFQQQGLKERQKQGLDKNRGALFAKYPTPEVKLEAAGGELPTVSVGAEAKVTATGRFVPGSLAQVGCPGAEVLSQKVTESRLEARVRVGSAALPGACPLRLFSPVSLASATWPAFRVAGSYQWELALANGRKARMRTLAQQGTPIITGTSEWLGKDGKVLDSRPVNLERMDEGYRVNVQRTETETAASAQVKAEASGENTQKQMHEIQQKMKQECMKLPRDQMNTCIQKYVVQLSAFAQKVQEKAHTAQQKNTAAAVGCEFLVLQVSDGKVTGQGTNCGALGEMAVTGTMAIAK